MIKAIIILFIMLNLINCNINNKILNHSNNHFNKNNITSNSANYLMANYSIAKGDAYTASEILNKEAQTPQLLEIKFFSNLVSGKFKTAGEVSKILKMNHKTNDLYDLPQYILKIKNNNIKESLEVFKNEKLFFNLSKLNHLIKLWINESENKNEFIFDKNIENFSIYELLVLENFHDSKKLIKIADIIYKKNNLNSHDLFLLAGFYYRAKKIETSKKIIFSRLSDQFDKKHIFKNFSKKKQYLL